MEDQDTATTLRVLPRCGCGCGIIDATLQGDEPETLLDWTVRLYRAELVGRFWDRVDQGPDDVCWLWTGTLRNTGYGVWSIRQQQVYAHRMAYELAWGPIPEGLVIDHLCRNRPCCNPYHLEAVTDAENNRRGQGFAGLNAQKTHCPAGHPYDHANTIWTKRGGRQCRKCQRAIQKTPRFRERRKQRRRLTN